MRPAFELREFVPADGDACRELFCETVRRVNSSDYSQVQILAWVNAGMAPEPWIRRFDGNFAYVVEHNGAIVGFVDMTRNGYLDRLFVSPDHQRKGIATLLMNAIESVARNNRLSRIHTQASITARPFFLSRGFKIVAPQTVESRGVEMTNFIMELKVA